MRTGYLASVLILALAGCQEERTATSDDQRRNEEEPDKTDGRSEGTTEGEADGEANRDPEPGDDGAGAPIGCRHRCDCPESMVCDPEIPPLGECLAPPAGCRGDADCVCGRNCVEGECKPECVDEACIPLVPPCTPCETDEGCGDPANVCIDLGAAGRFCTQPCALDPKLCPDGFRCVELEREEDDGSLVALRRCVPRVGNCESVCTFTGCDDPDKPHCSPISGKCEASFGACDPCRSQAQCGELTCLEYPREDEFHCLPPCPRGQSDCPEGTLCVNAARQCVQGGRCESDRDCGDGRLCDPQRHECYNNDATCAHNGDCPEGQVCDLNTLLCVDESGGKF